MLSVSDGFLDALTSPQRVTLQGSVAKGGVTLLGALPILGGSVTVDRSSVTRRTLTLDLAPRYPTGTYTDAPTLPETWTDPLGHYGQEVSLSWGLVYVSGIVEWVPLGVFRIDEVSGSLFHDDVVSVRGVSREAYVMDQRFTSPRTVSGPSAQSLIGTLIQEVDPTYQVVAAATGDRRVPRTTFDRDRWEAITTLAESIAAVVYADPWGRFVIEDAPTVGTPPVWTVAAGPGGVLVGASSSSSRARIYNGVVVEGESPSSDTPPVRATATDNGPTSATRWGDPSSGAFGRVPRFMSLPSVATREQAGAVARAQLVLSLGTAATLDLSLVPNPALEAGDVVDILTDPTGAGGVRRHILDTFTIPLAPGGAFTAATRDISDTSALVVVS